MLGMKSAEIWNYLVLCTCVLCTCRVFSRDPRLGESIEFSNKSVTLPRVSFRIIFAWYHCLQLRHALPAHNSHAISRAIYVKHTVHCFSSPCGLRLVEEKRGKSPRKYIRIFNNCSASHVKYPDLR